MGPDTLQDAIIYFASSDNCRADLCSPLGRWRHLPALRQQECPVPAKYNRWCGSKHDLRQFTSEAGSVFEDSALGLDKWLALFTDLLKSYEGLSEFEHQVIDHAVQYVNGKIHTNGMENCWSLLKDRLTVPT
jgi:hypothetical protein